MVPHLFLDPFMAWSRLQVLVAREALVAMNAFVSARYTLTRLELHGETLFSVTMIDRQVTLLPKLTELCVVDNAAVAPHLFLDTFVAKTSLNDLEFRPASPSRYTSGPIASVATSSDKYFLSLVISYFPVLGAHRSRMLDESPKFMDSLPGLMMTHPRRIEQVKVVLKQMTDICKGPHVTLPAQASESSSYSDQGDSDDMGLADDLPVIDHIVGTDAYKRAAMKLAEW